SPSTFPPHSSPPQSLHSLDFSSALVPPTGLLNAAHAERQVDSADPIDWWTNQHTATHHMCALRGIRVGETGGPKNGEERRACSHVRVMRSAAPHAAQPPAWVGPARRPSIAAQRGVLTRAGRPPHSSQCASRVKAEVHSLTLGLDLGWSPASE